MFIYQRLLRYVQPHGWILLLATLAMVAYAITETGFAALMKPLLDGSFVAKDPATVRSVPIWLLSLFALRAMAAFVSQYALAWISRSVISQLRQELFASIIHLPADCYDHIPSGKLVSTLTFTVEQVARATGETITVLVRDTVTIIGLMAWMFYLNSPLALIFLVLGPLFVILTRYMSQRFRHIARQIQNSMGEFTCSIEEAIGNYRVVKAFNGETYEQARFANINRENLRDNLRMTVTSAIGTPLVQSISAIALAGIIFLATATDLLKTVSVGTFISFVTAMFLLLSPIKRLAAVNPMLQQAIAAGGAIFAILDMPSEETPKTVQPLVQARGQIRYEQVTFAYQGMSKPALDRISLTIEPGQTVAFVGRSGSGKSTLVHLLLGFYPIEQGHLYLDGFDLKTLRRTSLRQQISWVSQEINLFNATVAENITYGCSGHITRQDIVQAAQSACALEFIESLPKGFETVIGERGILLSGGQRQRLAIARALLKNAPVLILDEATSALDSKSEQAIQEAIHRLIQNRTTLMIAHRLSTIQQADSIFVLNQGSIVERGTHFSLLAEKGEYATLYRHLAQGETT